MRQPFRTLSCAFTMAVAVLLAACGGRDSMASKSAGAYRDAQAKEGTPAGGGDAHDHGSTAPSAITTTDPHAGMNHGDHAAIGHAPATPHAANAHAGHGTTAASATSAHASHTSTDKAGAHAAHGTPSQQSAAHTQHGTNPHAQHSAASTPAATTSHAGHGAMQRGAVPTAPVQTEVPSSSAAMAAVRPDATLRPDPFDAAASQSIAESTKSPGGAATHSNHQGQPPAEVYACPMHPEVTSTTPGNCPKCGMTLVKRDNK